MTPRRHLITLIGFCLAVASCGGEAASEPTAAATATTAAPPTTTTNAGATASTLPPDIPELEWTENLLGGGTIDGTSFAGRDLVIWFYAPT